MKIKPGVFWPAVIAGALGLHVLVMLAMVYVATSNDSYAVEPDYYAKALAWDERRAQEQRNAELGWTLDFAVVPADPGADPVLRANLVDADGAPVTGARVAVEAFANVRRDDVLTATLDPTPGGYEVTIPMHRNGRWEFRFRVTRDHDVFTYRDTRHIYTEISR
ncbi:MAG: FixH family protein [Holophagae bacterium]|jgi:nitrogen fixation protein FixH